MSLLLITIISVILISIGIVVYFVMSKDPIYEGLQEQIATTKSDYDLIPVINLTKVPQTFSTWVKLEKPGTWKGSRTILGNKTDTTDRTLWLNLLGWGTPSVYIKGIGTFVSDFKLVPNEKWYNIVWVNDIENMKLSLYINGQNVQEWKHNIKTITPDIPTNIRIGFDTPDNYLDTGAITKVSIYRNVLSGEEIMKNFTDGLLSVTPAQPGPFKKYVAPTECSSYTKTSKNISKECISAIRKSVGCTQPVSNDSFTNYADDDTLEYIINDSFALANWRGYEDASLVWRTKSCYGDDKTKWPQRIRFSPKLNIEYFISKLNINP